MKFYEITNNSEYGEQPAKDSRTGERVTLTDKRAALMSGDYISVYRCEVVPNEDNGTPTETAFQFLVMNGSGSLSVYVCDIETGVQIIEQNLRPLLRGDMSSTELDEILNNLKDRCSDIKYTVSYINLDTNTIRIKNSFDSLKSAEVWISENAASIKPLKIVKCDDCVTCIKVYSADKGTATATEVIR